MKESEDTTSGTNMAQTETRAESDKGQKITSAGRGGREDRGNARNNTTYSLTSTSKYYKGGIEAFRAVLVLKYYKVYLKKSFDMFS